MRRFIPILTLLALVLAACSGRGTAGEPTPEPAVLLEEAVSAIRQKETFRLSVEHTGAKYFFGTDFGSLEFRRAEGQFVMPDKIQAKVRVVFGGLPVDADIYARGEDQWLRGIWTNQQWQNMIIVQGFNPEALISREDTGIGAAIRALKDVQLVGEETLIDGTPVYHLTATADGAEMSWLVVYLIEMTGQVNADLYIHRDSKLPVKFVIVQTESVAADQPDPTTWTIELYDFDEPAALDEPSAESTAEATAESTAAVATAEATSDG